MDHVEAGSSNHFDNRIIYPDPFSVYILQYMALRRRILSSHMEPSGWRGFQSLSWIHLIPENQITEGE